MKNIAVIGAGISGLAAASLLSRRHRVDRFEQERRLGGHTNTVLVGAPNGTVPLDTGFLVHNHRTSPNPEQYCVTLNPDGGIDDRRVLRRLVHRHPLYTREAIRAQRLWGDVSGVNRTHYCGACWRHGFHEDGLYSALRVTRALGVKW